MQAFVTGGGGFIGRHLVRRLVASGADVRAIARSDGSAAKLRDLGAEVVVGDVLDASALADALRGSDVAYHLAGDYRVGIHESDRAAMESANVIATERLLDAAVAAGVGRIVHVSTINAFGDTGYRVVDETYERPRPYRYVSFYDETKHRAQLAVHERIDAGAPVLIAMPGGVYGPGDHSSLGGQLREAADGRLRALTFGDAGLNMAHVEDIAAGIASRRRARGDRRVLRARRGAHDPRRARPASVGDRRAPAASHRHADLDASRGRTARAALRSRRRGARPRQRRRHLLGDRCEGAPRARLRSAGPGVRAWSTTFGRS